MQADIDQPAERDCHVAAPVFEGFGKDGGD
jgi:hypothetical protein